MEITEVKFKSYNADSGNTPMKATRLEDGTNSWVIRDRADNEIVELPEKLILIMAGEANE